MKVFFISCLCFLWSFCLEAQLLSFDTTLSHQELVYSVLMGDQSDLIVKNVRYTGAKQSIAYFTNDAPDELIEGGLILSTGNVYDAMGPNKATNTGSRTSARRDNDLQSIATSMTTDAAVLEFDLIALRDSLVFEYVFASEEYPEYVDKGVNDVFGFFIKEKESRALRARNMAVLPDGRTSVSIDNINHRRNEQYFLRSDFLHVHPPEFWKDHADMAMRAQIFEFDGFTVPMKATLKLKEGSTYHFKIAIADVGDRIFDSAVMLRAKSFGAVGKIIPQAERIVKAHIDEGLKNIGEELLVSSDSLNFSLRIQFNHNESIIQEQSKSELKQLVEIMKELRSLKLLIVGHTDNVGSNADNLQLSIDRAKAVKSYLTDHGVAPSRLNIAGKGESIPLAENDTEEGKYENRRVEFRFSY